MNATLRFDGGCRPTNPGPAACAWVIKAPNGDLIVQGSKFIGHATNNVAEYFGLVGGLAAALRHGVTDLIVVSDSKLVISQMNQSYRVKHSGLRILWEQAKELAARFRTIVFAWQRRANNTEADALCTAEIKAHEGEPETPFPGDLKLPEEYELGDGIQMSMRREPWFGRNV